MSLTPHIGDFFNTIDPKRSSSGNGCMSPRLGQDEALPCWGAFRACCTTLGCLDWPADGPYFSQNAPSFPGLGDADVTRSRRPGVIVVTANFQ
jgi:hypothetical protein